ncbi:hypothetical protein DPMN_092252 [Dreissena polymorpha]|uniref:Uncharacterized protein n=1 Tax=Dreissena polymorpha TaxID=45954 RepID=A0A9D4L174_DREPO|nr:hypothetical protein DPMN_092252 [Dreissena polymorpha]
MSQLTLYVGQPSTWSDVTHKLETKTRSKTIVWNNKDITSNNKTFFYKDWFELSIKYVDQLYDFRIKDFYSFDDICYIYGIPSNNFLKYYTLIKSIPIHIKSEINTNNTPCTQTKFLVVSSARPPLSPRRIDVILKGNFGWARSMLIDRFVIRDVHYVKTVFFWLAWSMWAGRPRIDRIVIREVQYQLEVNRCRNEEVYFKGSSANSVGGDSGQDGRTDRRRT